MIKQIKFVSIPVADQNRALDFYTEKLGFTIITDQPFDDKQRWIELRVPKAETRVVLFTTDEDRHRVGTFMNVSYTCDNLQKTYEELRARGVEFENPPKKEPWGNFAIFKDSEGNKFVLGDLSSRKATMGSMRLARRAGIQHAIKVVKARTAATRIKVFGSIDFTSNNTFWSARERAIALTNPMPPPMANKVIPWPRIKPRICDGCAPSARRTPISRNRFAAV